MSQSLICLSWMAALGFIQLAAPAVAISATVPFDEPPCYIRTQDGIIVNLQSFCNHATSPQTQSNPAINQSPQRTLSPQVTPTQALPTGARATAGSHAQGNSDSDDGNY